MRDRLIELLKDALQEWDCYLTRCSKNEETLNKVFEEVLADCLLQDDVIVLPCKLGDKMFDISEFFDDTTNSPEIYRYKAEYINVYKKYPDKDELWFEIDGIDAKFDDFGKTLFFSEKEAEQALKEGEQG